MVQPSREIRRPCEDIAAGLDHPLSQIPSPMPININPFDVNEFLEPEVG